MPPLVLGPRYRRQPCKNKAMKLVSAALVVTVQKHNFRPDLVLFPSVQVFNARETNVMFLETAPCFGAYGLLFGSDRDPTVFPAFLRSEDTPSLSLLLTLAVLDTLEPQVEVQQILHSATIGEIVVADPKTVTRRLISVTQPPEAGLRVYWNGWVNRGTLKAHLSESRSS
jgi:hypothetical protein